MKTFRNVKMLFLGLVAILPLLSSLSGTTLAWIHVRNTWRNNKYDVSGHVVGRQFSSSCWGERLAWLGGPPSSSSPSSSSLVLHAVAWQVGDKVWVNTPASNGDNDENEEDRLPAVITNIQGRGWLTVELLAGNKMKKKKKKNSHGNMLKTRSTRLQRRNDNDHEDVQQVPVSSSTIATPSLNRTTKLLDPLGENVAERGDWEPDDLPVMDATQMFRPLGARRRSQTTSEAPPSSPPSSPLIIDLDTALLEQKQASSSSSSAAASQNSETNDAFMEQVRHHAQTTRWVAFTDLHVAPSTLETCLQVLDHVHSMAVARNAGVIFLGDFWHYRGTLRVDCLNAVLERLQTWQVPLVMIPGNHDQVTLGGHVHGLTALQNAYSIRTANNTTVPGPLIFSHPTVFQRALWIPHVRDHGLMETILQSSYAQSNVKAILCHADVTGASMNDLIISTGGVPPRFFPPRIPIYSGHFHKAHSVTTRNERIIEYIGSPYQVSLSEAHQPKALVVMDENWQTSEQIPLQLGRLHFRPTKLTDFMALELAPSRQDGNDKILCAGDRVVWSVDAKEWETLRKDDAVEQHIQALRGADVAVEIRQSAVGKSSSVKSLEREKLEELTPRSTWEAFVQAEVHRGAWTAAHAAQLRAAGLELLASVEGDESVETPARSETPSATGSQLDFHSLTIEGFGPFETSVDYPLDQRGMVLVRGTNKDGGSDSNGVGKSSLAMASLWALTGTLDPRPLPDGKVADVVHDKAPGARVVLRGAHNGNQFTIVRSKTKSRGSLTFFYQDEDRTTQSVRETQLVIEEVLGISSTNLFRSVFFGQHPLNDLLDATDTRFKEELSLLVPLATWQEALTVARKRTKTSEKRIAELNGMIAVRKDDLESITTRWRVANETFQEAKRVFDELEKSLAAELDAMQDPEGLNNGIYCPEAIQRASESLSLSIELYEKEREKYLSDREEALERFDLELTRKNKALQETLQNVTKQQRSLDIAELKYQSAVQDIKNLEAEWKLDLRHGSSKKWMLPSLCPTCGQPLSEESNAHAHSNVQQAIEAASTNRQTAEKERAETQLTLAKAEDFHNERVVSLAHTEDTKAATLSWLDKRIEHVDREIRKAWQEREKHTIELAEATRQKQAWLEAKAAHQKLDSERESLNRLEATAESIAKDKYRYEEMINSLETEQNHNSDDAMLLKELSLAFSQRGIQVFVLRNALEALQAVTQTYLDELSDSTLELRLYLEDGDRILRQVVVSSGTERNVRSLASLSGGQWRRCSLALQLGFADLLSRRGKFGSSLLVFDEPLTHLDRSGRSAFGRVLRRLLLGNHSTILLILQDLAAEELEESFDAVDEVVKSQDRSVVNVHDAAASG